MSNISTDVTVYGATSFAAKHVLRYLLAASEYIDIDGSDDNDGNETKKEKKKLRVTLGGRSKSKLEALKDSDEFDKELAASIFQDIFVADGSDFEALQQMAKRSKVILNCAGPFEKHSSLVVAACAKMGTDYVDITGEGSWNATMRLKYGPQAKVSGARIISFCGYDSIPSDMVLFAAVEALRERKKPTAVEIDSATLWHSMSGGLPNGGTLQTLVDYPIDLWNDFFKKVTTTSDSSSGGAAATTSKAGYKLRTSPYCFGDPLMLTHPEKVRYNPDYETTRNRFAWGEWLNQLLHIDVTFSFGVSQPMIMAAINMKVMQASAVALNYGPNFSVRERNIPLGYHWTRVIGIMALGPLILAQVGLLLFLGVLFFPFGVGSNLVKMLWPPGKGPPDYLVDRGSNSVYAMVTAAGTDDSADNDTVDRAYCYMSYQGDAGNSTTAQCVAEAALTLVCNRSDLPPRSEDGFGTPAEILGQALLDRLKSNKVRPVTVSCSVRTRTVKNEMKLYLEQ